MTETLLTFLGAVIGAVLVFLGNRRMNNSQATAVDVETFHKLVDKVDQIQDELLKTKEKMSVLFSYLLDLLEDYRRRGVRPPEPPKILESDPLLKKFYDKHKSDPAMKAVNDA